MSDPELLARHRAVTPSWLALYYDEPIELVRGEGRHVWDRRRQPLPRLLRWHPHDDQRPRVPEVVDAVREQAGKMLHTSTLYLSAPMIELAEKLAGLSGIPDAKVFLTTSGTEANEAALLAATSYRRSNQILALRNSYHGRSFGTIAITGQPIVVADEPVGPAGVVRARRLPAAQPVPRTSTTTRTRPRACRTSATSSTCARAATSPA